MLAVDRDETHARLALHNAAVYGEADRVTAVVADVRDVPLAGIDAVFIDPARRSGPGTASAAGTRTVPRRPLRAAARLVCRGSPRQVPAVCVKAAPGIPEELIPPGWEAEFIAEGRDLKEAVLWSPALATAGQPRRQAPRAITGPARAARPSRAPPPAPGPRGHPRRRTRATRSRCANRGSTCSTRTRPSPGPAWSRTWPATSRATAATSPRSTRRSRSSPWTARSPTPFARTLRVLHSAPWHEKQFAKRLRDLGIGAVDIRRRGLAGDVDQIRRRLKLAGVARATVVITRVNDQPWGLICTDPDSPSG